MKILLLGSGGREYALARAMTKNASHELYCAPGNPGTAALGTNLSLNETDAQAVANWACENQVDLVVVGPEAPLVAGVADAVRAAGIPVFGPDQAAARLEGSKSFAKEIMAAAGVKTARSYTCVSVAEVTAALADFTPPYVVKNDGLAAGKGVVVTADYATAEQHALECISAPGGAVVIEDYLDGPEVSLFCVSDGKTVVPLQPAQDFKRIFDADQGPNTGGMGAYSPLPWLPAGFVDEVVTEIAQPMIDTMAQRGTPFVGLLYCGLACTSKGTQVIEFNARFGDPETQVILPLLDTPLTEVLYAAATGTLAELPPLQWSEKVGVGVVMAAPGYPGKVTTGTVVSGVDVADAREDVQVMIAGARGVYPAGLETSGGRVFTVCAQGEDLAAARELAYSAVADIHFEGAQYRTDIALKAANQEISVPESAGGCDCDKKSTKVRAWSHPVVEIPGWTHFSQGKVRDLYVNNEDDSLLLVVASDRISAYDFVLETPIPDKGKILTQLSAWWFAQLGIANHVVSLDVPPQVAGRAMICRRLNMYPVECVARGYLTGSGLQEYRQSRSICGVALPAGLTEASVLPEPIFTPAAKAEVGEHDENVSFERIVEMVGIEAAEALRSATLEIYSQAAAIAAERGIILADTKFEFGQVNGQLVLGDEVLTPDSSRFWPAEQWIEGQVTPSFDKQYVRDWLLSAEAGWDRVSPPPALPAEVVEATRGRYVEAFEKLTGRKFEA